MELRILPQVRIEFRKVTIWRTENLPRTARGFVQAYEAALEKIQESPTRYPTTEEGLSGVESRYLTLRRYPYNVVYVVRETEIVVALVHHRQDSAAWLDRLPEES
jgi:plasmid stabilization system protein ParE